MKTRNTFGQLVLSFYVPSLLLAFSNGLLVPVLPIYTKELSDSYALVGLVLAGEALGMLLGDVPSGMLVRRFGHRRAMLLGVGGTALSTVALAWASSVPEALVYRVITGFSVSLYSVARHAYVAEAVIVGSRGRALSLFGGLMRIGRFLGPLVGGTVAARYGLRSTFLLFGAADLLAVAFIAIYVRIRTARPQRDVRQEQSLLSSQLAILKGHYRVLLSAGAGQLFAQMIRAGRAIIIPLYAADVIGLDVQTIGLIESLSSAVDMSLFYVAGLLMDRLGRKFAIVPSFSIQSLGMFLVPFTSSFASLLFASVVIGLGNGIGSGTMMTLGADLAPPGARGEFLGMWRLIGDTGHAAGPLIVGQVAEALALPAAAWVMSGGGLIAALIFACFVPETLNKRPRPVQVSPALEAPD